MSRSDTHIHRVCTPDEALDLMAAQNEIWVSDCICRTGSTGCSHDRANVCIEFVPTRDQDKFHTRRLDLAEAREIVEYARSERLVLRPCTGVDDNAISGICTCCDCCCTFSHFDHHTCEKGRMIEQTIAEYCAGCAQCVDVCRFEARRVIGQEIVINRANCYGCGLCAEACPVEGVRMILRTGAGEESAVIRRTPAPSVLNQPGVAKSYRPPV